MKKTPNLLILVLCLLSACSKTPEHTFVNDLSVYNPYPQSASEYLRFADKAAPEQAAKFYLLAAGRLIKQHELARASEQLNRLKHLSATEQAEKWLLLGQISYLKRNYKLALNQLLRVGSLDADRPSLYLHHQRLLAKAYLANNRVLEAVNTRLAYADLLPNQSSHTANVTAIWQSLDKMSLEDLQAKKDLTEGALQGWLALALLVKENADESDTLLAKLTEWQSLYPKHAANELLPSSLNLVASQLQPKPRQLALLLPLSGPLQQPGKAVRDGFMQSYYESKAPRPKLRFYNTAADSFASLYALAVRDGADYIAGPLSKQEVKSLLGKRLPVRTVALNVLNKKGPSELYQFGLSPQSEATLVANKMTADGLKRVLVIAPDSAWGNAIVASFSARLAERGGVVRDKLMYQPRTALGPAIQAALHVSDSAARGRDISRLLNNNVKFTPQRRQDVDAIFLLAYPSVARQVKPLLNYYYAKDLPVYATSSVYAGSPDSRKDRDLNGIIFCDMPFVFGKGQRLKHHLWQEQLNSYTRLYALGKDAFLLSAQLDRLLLFPALGISDNTGVLYSNERKQIQRELPFAQFVDGKPRLFLEG